jgi:flagellar hook-length control protein FliK
VTAQAAVLLAAVQGQASNGQTSHSRDEQRGTKDAPAGDKPSVRDLVAGDAAAPAGGPADATPAARADAAAQSGSAAPAAAHQTVVSFGADAAVAAVKSATVLSLAVSPAATTATVSASTGGTLPADTANQIVQAMRLQWTEGAGEARIRLEPDQFGELTISLRVERGQVVAHVESDTAVVREWLQSNQSSLRHSLAEQNLTLDRLEVVEPRESRDADRRNGGRPNGGDEPPPRRPRPRPVDRTFEVVA